MNLFRFSLRIERKTKDGYIIIISDENHSQSTVLFDPEEKILTFESQGQLTDFLKKHEYQFRKILHNKRANTFFPGFELNFVIWENKNMLDFNNNSKLVTFDHTEKTIRCSFEQEITPEITVFTDGSYNEQKQKGAISVITRNSQEHLQLFTQVVDANNNNEVELRAAIKALEQTKPFKIIRLLTDSRYVKKGITEWIFYWQINNWMTANGTQAKNVLLWKKIVSLTAGKIIQFGWVKGHAETLENKLCDFYAKQTLRRYLNG